MSKTPWIRISPRSALMLALTAAAGLVAFSWPLFLPPGNDTIGSSQTPLLFAALLLVVLALVITELSQQDMDVKALAMLGVLSAVGAVLRPLGAGAAGLETVFFLLIVAGRVFGPGFGFILGSTTLFSSALITAAIGPWLPFQMIAAGFVGLGAGLLPRTAGSRTEIALLAGYGAVCGFAFGFSMDLAFWPFTLGPNTQLSFDAALGPLGNLHRFVLFNVATAMGWNAGRALMNVLMIVVLGTPLLRILRRTARRAHFEPVTTSRT